jgi:hypothetical protein
MIWNGFSGLLDFWTFGFSDLDFGSLKILVLVCSLITDREYKLKLKRLPAQAH